MLVAAAPAVSSAPWGRRSQVVFPNRLASPVGHSNKQRPCLRTGVFLTPPALPPDFPHCHRLLENRLLAHPSPPCLRTPAPRKCALFNGWHRWDISRGTSKMRSGKASTFSLAGSEEPGTLVLCRVRLWDPLWGSPSSLRGFQRVSVTPCLRSSRCGPLPLWSPPAVVPSGQMCFS